jgi:plasmid stability protein
VEADMDKHVKRYTVYLEEDLHRALKVKAAETEYSVSDLVNRAIRESLLEDAIDLAAIEERKNDKEIPYEEFLRKLKKDGRL